MAFVIKKRHQKTESKEYSLIIVQSFVAMFGGAESQKTSFLEQTKAARAERAFEKKRETDIVIVQAQIRGWVARRNYLKRIM